LPPAREAVGITIEVDPNAKGPRLVLPNGVFTPPRVRPFPKTSPPPKGELPIESGDEVTMADDAITAPRHNLLIAGLALSLSLGFGGFWMVRRHGRGSLTGLAVLIATTGMLIAGAVAWADIAVPPRPPINKQPPLKKAESFPIAFEGKGTIDFVYGNEPVRLILDRESFEKLKKADPK